MKQAGFTGTNSAAARSWLSWGISTKPRLGAVVVLSRPPDPSHGHVGILLDDGPLLYLLSGNAENRVCVRPFPHSRLLSMRWPT